MGEQQERRNVGEKEGGQSSRSSGQTGLELEEHRIVIDEISPRLKNRIGSFKKIEERSQSQSQTQWPRMRKVPQMVKETQDFKKFYEPWVISFGPYHHGKPHLHQGEKIKPVCAQKFLADSDQDFDTLYKKIESKIKQVRECYDKRATKKYDDKALASMMLLDGCFLLHFIRSGDNMNKVLRNHQIYFVERDLFLLENQLPFGVLKLIFEGAKFQGGSTMEEKIKKFVTPDTGSLEEEDEEPSHLLDLLRSALLGSYKKSSKQEERSQPDQEQETEKNGESSSSSTGGGDGGGEPEQEQEGESLSSLSGGGDGGSQPEHEQEPEEGGDGRFCCAWKKSKQQGNWQSFRHIKELKAAGIHLKPSSTSFLTDISFKSYFFYGYLKLPPIIIDDSTKPKFLNIVAYEMCQDAPDDYAVTSYICFLYDLIDHADDVKEMRSKHILYNCLGSDQDVAQIFNEIGDDLVDPDAYEEVKLQIQKHYEKRLNTWIAQALHDHFSTPWTIMAFFAAVLILFLTGIQTYYAVPGNPDY